jgi:septation ring formation regulator EzrA
LLQGELWILQEENTLLKEKVVSLQHGEACSSSESTEDSLTESAERIDSIRRQIAAVVASRKKGEYIINSRRSQYRSMWNTILSYYHLSNHLWKRNTRFLVGMMEERGRFSTSKNWIP